MKVPWNAPETDSQGRVHTQRGYWAKRGGKSQFKIDKYEKDIMAPLTREEQRLFYPVIAWFLALPLIGIGGMFVGLMLMPLPGGNDGFADWLFSNALGLTGLVVIVACWVLPVVKGMRENAKAVKTIRDAREDAFEEWRRSGQREASSDYSDDDDGANRTYPVTGGVYDPDLYSDRGGHSTFEAVNQYPDMDYDTWKSNVE